jgi:hypothetical protein
MYSSDEHCSFHLTNFYLLPNYLFSIMGDIYSCQQLVLHATDMSLNVALCLCRVLELSNWNLRPETGNPDWGLRCFCQSREVITNVIRKHAATTHFQLQLILSSIISAIFDAVWILEITPDFLWSPWTSLLSLMDPDGPFPSSQENTGDEFIRRPHNPLISARRPAILAEGYRGFRQSFVANSWTVH